MFKTLLTGLILTFFICQSNAQVYKWIDENGKVHYSDKPIDDKAKTLDIKNDISATRQQEARAQANKLIRSQRRQLANEQEVKRDDAIAEQKRNQKERKLNYVCKRARASLRALEYQAPVYQENAKGERTYLDDETRKKETLQLKAEIQQHCTSED